MQSPETTKPTHPVPAAILDQPGLKFPKTAIPMEHKERVAEAIASPVVLFC